MTMAAVVMRRGALELIEAPIPRPHWGEVLVRTLATGICGSDLHCVSHGAELVAGVRAVSGVELFDLDEPIVLGHNRFRSVSVVSTPLQEQPDAVTKELLVFLQGLS